MTELCHEREGGSSNKNSDQTASDDLLSALHFIVERQLLLYVSKERSLKKELHGREHRSETEKHRGHYQQLLCVCGVIAVIKSAGQIERLIEPLHCDRKAVLIVRGKTVVRHKKFHSPGTSVFKASVGLVPGGRRRVRSEKLVAERRFEKVVGNSHLIISEITEFVVFCLKKQYIIELNAAAVISAVSEKLSALQNSRLGHNILSVFAFCIRVCCSDRPACPGTHGMSADSETCAVNIGQRSKKSICVNTATARVSEAVSVIIGDIFLIEEAQI